MARLKRFRFLRGPTSWRGQTGQAMGKQDFAVGAVGGSDGASRLWTSYDTISCNREVIHAPGAIQPLARC